MKTQLEEIFPPKSSSMRLMINPNLSDFFFWHFHPEYELVYIEGASGNRHVGEHFSRYEDSDLVFIGSNIPHLNFDYGVKSSYEKIVIHIKADFLQYALVSTPELLQIANLFEDAKKAVAFGSITKAMVGERIKAIHKLNYFDQFIELLRLLQLLSEAPDKEFLHDYPVENQHNKRDQERLKKVYAFVDANYQRKIDIAEVASISHLSKEAFCRYFKKMTKLTFTAFVNHYRIDTAKKLLLLDKNITETCYESGFESLSYFNRMFKRVTGENPLAFKKRVLMSNDTKT